jgi:hypothetical protein
MSSFNARLLPLSESTITFPVLSRSSIAFCIELNKFMLLFEFIYVTVLIIFFTDIPVSTNHTQPKSASLECEMTMCYPQYPITPAKSNYAISYRVKIMILAQIVVLVPDLAHTLGRPVAGRGASRQ